MNRSEELCKLLGIKPKIEYFIQFSYFDEIHREVEEIQTWIVGKNKLIEFMQEDAKTKVIATTVRYPDLTKPSNFVKLLFFKFPNFNNEYYNILEFMSDNFVEIENANEYIESLYEQLKLEDKRIIKDLAKQAQATKWDY